MRTGVSQTWLGLCVRNWAVKPLLWQGQWARPTRLPAGSFCRRLKHLRNLLDGVIDGFLADRITAATTAWRRHEGARIEEHPLRFSTNIHFMLSRATQTPQML